MRVLLVAAGLCMGANAWADTTIADLTATDTKSTYIHGALTDYSYLDMKTVYVKPETTIVKVSLSTILASSPGIVSEGTADTTTQQDGGGYMLSRENNSIWDDKV